MIQTKDTELWERDQVRTEAEIFHTLKDRLEGDRDVTYLAFPWAPWLNGLAPTPPLEHQGEENVFTVCQHVRFREITGFLAEAGVKTLFTPHATRSEPYIDDIRILGLPHFPSSYKAQVAEPDILFSFIGAPTATVRQEIVRRLGGSCHIKLREAWHFSIQREQRELEKSEYAEVMSRSKFALCPRGTGPSSLRVWEAIAAGVIPVIIADDLRLPIGIDWDRCSIRIGENDIDEIPDLLSGLSHETYQRLCEGVRTAKSTLEESFAFPVLRWLDQQRGCEDGRLQSEIGKALPAEGVDDSRMVKPRGSLPDYHRPDARGMDLR